MTWKRHLMEMIERSKDEESIRHHSNHGGYEDPRLPHRAAKHALEGGDM